MDQFGAEVESRRLLLIGGSTSSGLGVGGYSYGVRVGELWEATEVLNMTASGPLIDHYLSRWDEVEAFGPNLAVVSLGLASRWCTPRAGCTE